MKNLLRKLGLLAVVVLAGQYAYTAVNPPKAPRQIRMLQRFLAEDTEIIYFGDSTVHHYSQSDRNKEPISAMLAELPPRCKVGKVAAAAYNLDVFAHFVDYLVSARRQPRIVIIPVNLGSFSPEWDMRPEYQFEKEKLYLKLARWPLLLAFYRPLAVFSNLQPVSRSDYRRQPVRFGNEVVGTLAEFDNESFQAVSAANTRKKLILRYMARLDPDHRKLHSLRRIAATLRTTSIEPVFYISPVDYQTGERYLGSAFRDRIAENCAIVKRLLAEEGFDTLDLSFSLGPASFNWGNYQAGNLYPNEHMKESGRRRVARELSMRLVSIEASLARAERRVSERSGGGSF